MASASSFAPCVNLGDTRYFILFYFILFKKKKKNSCLFQGPKEAEGEDRGRANCDKEPTPPGELAASTIVSNRAKEGGEGEGAPRVTFKYILLLQILKLKERRI